MILQKERYHHVFGVQNYKHHIVEQEAVAWEHNALRVVLPCPVQHDIMFPSNLLQPGNMLTLSLTDVLYCVSKSMAYCVMCAIDGVLMECF